MKYDCIIVGAGMSGLAAGIRLAHFGKKVCLVEKHSRGGGLNSFYFRNGIEIDAGLHAMTNFVRKDGDKNSPLMKLLRQLRISYDSLELCQQKYSLIKFDDAELRFSNDFAMLDNEIAEKFPKEMDGFRNLCRHLDEYNELDLNAGYISARYVLQNFIRDPLLADMILCPLMYYGSAVEGDMDFSQFAIMFKSIFRQGFCRPERGVKQIIGILEERFKSCGGELRYSCEVRKIKIKDGVCKGVELADGAFMEASAVLSSAGSIETLSLCDTKTANFADLPEGQLAFVEAIYFLNEDADLNVRLPGYSIMFFNASHSFEYRRPAGLGADLQSGVLCCPHNFCYTSAHPPRKLLRMTALSDFAFWNSNDKMEYRRQKEKTEAEVTKRCSELVGFDISGQLLMSDFFTPLTISRYTGHRNGAVYGSPLKIKDGATGIQNLFLCGTDQGFLGITGAMLSGISIANMRLLKQ